MCINYVCTFIEFRNNEQKFFHTIRRLTHRGHRTQYRQQNFNAFWGQILGLNFLAERHAAYSNLYYHT